MLKTYYHCFIAGLPDLVFEDLKYPSTLKEFKDYLEEELSAGDKQLVSLLFLPHDHKNLINYLLKNEAEFDPLSNFSVDDFDEQAARLDAILEQEPLLPEYMIRFMRDFYDEDKEVRPEEFEKILISGYFETVLSVKNDFLLHWLEFDLNSRNIITSVICRKHDVDVLRELIGNNAIVEQLLGSKGRNTEIRTDDDYLDEIIRITEIEDLNDRERRVDLLRWDFLETNTFFHYFTVEKIIAYLIKLFIVFRWKELDKETGRQMFERMIAELKSSYQLPAEFNLIKR